MSTVLELFVREFILLIPFPSLMSVFVDLPFTIDILITRILPSFDFPNTFNNASFAEMEIRLGLIHSTERTTTKTTTTATLLKLKIFLLQEKSITGLEFSPRNKLLKFFDHSLVSNTSLCFRFHKLKHKKM